MRIDADTWRCDSCQNVMAVPYSNGDGQDRCEACAVKEFEVQPMSSIRFRPCNGVTTAGQI